MCTDPALAKRIGHGLWNFGFGEHKGEVDAHREEVWRMLGDPRTHVYVAGLEAVRDGLDDALAAMAGSAAKWQRRKAELVAGGRWTELLY